MTLQSKLLALAATATVAFAPIATATAQAAEIYVPNLSYRTGPFAGGGIPFANGFGDYFAMLNERDGGIGGLKVKVDECETGYDSQKGVECYEATKGNNPVVYTPLSTGISLAIIPQANVDKIPVLQMGYGLSAGGIGETFPYAFTYPTSYWNQMSSILKYIDQTAEGGIKGKKIGYIYLDAGYGKEPIPVLDKLAETMGFTTAKFPVAGKDMQNQGSQWLNVRKERPDYMIMWGWGAMNATAIKEAIKTRYPLDKFIGNWWAGANADLDGIGAEGKGYLAANFSGVGTDYPALKDVQKYVIEPGKGLGEADKVGDVLYNRGLYNAVLIAEGIKNAQQITGKAEITGEDMKLGLEAIDLSAARLEELGLKDFTSPLKGSCKDHEGGSPVFIQRWEGDAFVKVSENIEPMLDVTRPLLEEAAAGFIADKPNWQGQKCDG